MCPTTPQQSLCQAGNALKQVVWAWLLASGIVFSGTLAGDEPRPAIAAPASPILERLPPPAGEEEPYPILRRLPAVEAESPAETLDAAWHVALQRAPVLNAASLSIDAASSGADAARAKYLPHASLGASYFVRDSDQSFRLPSSPLLPDGGAFPFAQREGAGLQTALELPIYRGGLIRYETMSKDAATEAARFDLAEDVLTLKMQVAAAFLEVLRSESRVPTAETHLQSVTSHLESMRKRHSHQQVPRYDVLIAESAVSDARVAVIHARSGLAGARSTYNRLLRRPLDSPVNLSEPHLPPLEGEIQQATQQAMTYRPELAKISYQIEAIRHQSEMALAANRMHVSLQAGYDFQENRYQTPQGLGFVGFKGIWNVFDGGRARAEWKSQSQQADALAQLRSDLELQIQLEIKRAWLDRAESRNRLSLLHESVDQSREHQRVTRQRFRNGAATGTDLLQAESFYTRTMGNLHEARYDALLADIRLRKAVGSL